MVKLQEKFLFLTSGWVFWLFICFKSQSLYLCSGQLHCPGIDWTFLLPGFFWGSYNLCTAYLIKFEFLALNFILKKKQVQLPVQRMLECDIKPSPFKDRSKLLSGLYPSGRISSIHQVRKYNQICPVPSNSQSPSWFLCCFEDSHSVLSCLYGLAIRIKFYIALQLPNQADHHLNHLGKFVKIQIQRLHLQGF